MGEADEAFEIDAEAILYQSEVVLKSQNPSWKLAELDLDALDGYDWDAPLLLQCWDWDRTVPVHDIIGTRRITLNDLRNAIGSSGFELRNALSPAGVSSGVIEVLTFEKTTHSHGGPTDAKLATPVRSVP